MTDKQHRTNTLLKSLSANLLWLAFLVPVGISYEDVWNDAHPDSLYYLSRQIFGQICLGIYTYYLNFPFGFILWFFNDLLYLTLFISWINAAANPFLLNRFTRLNWNQISGVYTVVMYIPLALVIIGLITFALT